MRGDMGGDAMKWPDDYINQVVIGDCLRTMADIPDEIVQTCITSPPYWGLRDYGYDGQLGLEATPDEYVAKMVEVFREVRRLLRPDGTLWLNLGDSYASTGRSDRYESPGVGATQAMASPGRKVEWKAGGGSNFSWQLPGGIKPKDLVGIPWMVAFALRADGWYLRSDIIWSKPNPMPESVTDRPTKAHEYLFLLSKNGRYYYDAAAISEPGVRVGETGKFGWMKGADIKEGDPMYRSTGQQGNSMTTKDRVNKRSVWEIATRPYKEAHFATFPEKLIDPCILAGSKAGDIILDPFGGSGTTAKRSKELGRRYIHIDLSYQDIAEDQLRQKELF